MLRDTNQRMDMTLATTERPVTGEPNSEEIVRLSDLSVHFSLNKGGLGGGSSQFAAVDGVDLIIKEGATVGVVGGTGSGKSTLAHVIMGMVKPTRGTLVIRGRENPYARRGEKSKSRATGIQVVLQDPFSSLNPRMTVSDIIAEPLTLSALTRRARRERVSELLELVGLSPAKANAHPHQFSGGQRQRIALARALAPNPALIVLDEPTSALDVSVRAQILNLLKSLQDRLGITYMIISHDLMTVAYLSSTVAVMHLGRIVEIAPTTELYSSPRHPYTLELLASVPKAEGGFLLPAQVTHRPVATTPACKFAPRCPLRAALGDPDVCITHDPGLRQVALGHKVACHFSDDVQLVQPRPANRSGDDEDAPLAQPPT